MTKYRSFGVAALLSLTVGLAVAREHQNTLPVRITSFNITPEQAAKLKQINALTKAGGDAFQAKDYATAEGKYREALALEPRLHFAHIVLGQIYLATNKEASALDELRLGIAIDPKTNTPRNNNLESVTLYGDLCAKRKLNAEAIQAYRWALLNPMEMSSLRNTHLEPREQTLLSLKSAAHTLLAIHRLATGRHADAVEETKIAIEADSHFWAAYLYQGMALGRRQDREKARAAFDQALALAPADQIDEVKLRMRFYHFD